MRLGEETHRGGEEGEMEDKLRGIGMLYFSLKRVNVSQQLLLLVNRGATEAKGNLSS